MLRKYALKYLRVKKHVVYNQLTNGLERSRQTFLAERLGNEDSRLWQAIWSVSQQLTLLL